MLPINARNLTFVQSFKRNQSYLLGHPYAVALARWSLAGVLLVAGISKLFDRTGFVQAVESYQILPKRLSRLFAFSLPYSEITAGFALLVGLGTRAAAMLAIFLVACFTTAIVFNLARSRDLDCHCFGNLHQEKISAASLLRNLIFILLAVEVIIFADGYLAIDGWLFGMKTGKSSVPPVTGLIPLILAVVTLLIAYLLIRQVWTIRRVGQS